jgi:cell division protein FtsB
MAGLEFDRQAFIPSNAPQGRSVAQLLVPLVVVVALALLAFVGYKIFLVNAQNNETASANAQVQQLEQQVSEMQKRIDALERHRKGVQAEASPAPSPAAAPSPATTKAQRTVYRIVAASAQPAQTKTTPPSPNDAAPATATRTSPEIVGEVNANREAWQATTNRLADVVGVVGTQQGEISATRDAVNQLLAQTHRQAVSFEVDRHNEPIPIGPVTLQFKSADSKGQHYTLCVFFDDQKCIEVRDRALNEVVVFVVTKNQPPLELVATKINRDQIVGYLEIPTAMQ